MKHYYELYKKYCKQLHLTPVEYKDFHINLYHQLKILVHSCFGSYVNNKQQQHEKDK